MKLLYTNHGAPRHPNGDSEDAYRVVRRDDHLIAALADGLGASREGAAAARRAVDMIADYYAARPQAWSPRRALGEFAGQINRIFFQESQLRHGSPELLCTLSVVVVEQGRLYGLNVGDSPVYLWRRGQFTRLSDNHALNRPGMEHVLTRAVGLEPDLEPCFFENDVEDSDVLLLCSDGVSAAVSESDLRSLLARRAPARSVVAAAQESADANPELRDDASAIVIEVLQRGWLAGADAARQLVILPTPSANDVLDDYRLVRPLQEGGRVWLAENTQTSTRHVLKLPPLEAGDDEARREGFLRELWQAARIDAPAFIRASIPTEGALRYYVMDYIEAPTLRAVLGQGLLRVEDAVALGRFLLEACQYLLSRDYAHGDVKPENILVLRPPASPAFRLIDLGSAAEIFSVTSRAGTPSYLAPERFQGGALSERTEIFAIGVTLYEALTGTYPYGEIERFQTPRFENPPKRITRLNPAVPPWLDSIVQRALVADPEDRYQNLSEMAFDLTHPDQVRPFHPKNASLIERNPLRFYKLLALVLFLTNLALLIRMAMSR